MSGGYGEFMANVQKARLPAMMAKPSHRLSVVAAAQPFSTVPNVAGANYTFVTNIPSVGGDFFAVQLEFLNHSTSAALTIDAATVAAVETALNNGFGKTFIAVTVNGQATFNVPPATGVTPNIIPGRVLSDVIFVISIPRTDGGMFPLLQTRVYMSGTPTLQVVSNGAAGTFNKQRLATGLEYALGYAGGNSTTGSSAVNNISESNNNIVPAGVRFYCNKSLAVVAQGGDSLSCGLGSSSGHLNSLAFAQVKSGFAFTYISRGVPGQGHTASYQTALDLLAAGGIQALSIWALSPNDPPTQAKIDTSWAETLHLVQKSRSQGVTPFVHTSGPKNANSQAQNAFFLQQNNRVRALCASGAAVLCDDALLLDPTASGVILPQYDSGDGLHYGDAGYKDLGEKVFYPALLSVGMI